MQIMQVTQRQPQQADGWPFHLPAPAAAAVARHLRKPDRKALRLVCKTAQAFADEHAQRLKLNILEPCSLLSRPLPQRFSAVKRLTVHSGLGTEAPPATVDERLPAALGDVWPSITALEFRTLPAAAVELLVRACPNATTCTFGHYGNIWPAKPVPVAVMTASIAAVSRLDALNKLELTNPISAQELLAIAQCSQVVSLKANVADCSAAGWRALMGMQQLKALDLCYLGRSTIPLAAISGLQQLTCLTSLALCMGLRLEGGDPGERANMLPAALQLPPSISTLNLLGVPLPTRTPLPHLSSLNMDRKISSTSLAFLAASPLKSLAVGTLVLDERCHATPLKALKSLAVTRVCTAAPAARLALLAPAVKELSLRCGGEFASDGALLEGLAHLKSLDGSASDVMCDQAYAIGATNYQYKGVSLDARGMEVVAALPRLKTLTLVAEAAHVAGLAALTRLQHIKLVVMGVDYNALHALAAALGGASLPQQLRSVVVEFDFADDEGEYEPEDEDEGGSEAAWMARERRAALERVVDALVLLLARSEGPAQLTWVVDEAKVAVLSELGLWALAGNASIECLEVVCWQGDGCGPRAVEQVMRKHGARGLRVVQRKSLWGNDRDE